MAVRGKTTLELVSRKRKVGDILLCDPGLMLSRLYHPDKPVQKTHKVGIIAHYVDEGKIRNLSAGKPYHVISMQTDNIEALARDILSCEVILSSSLHGIIFAHSYGVPAYHVMLTDFFKNGNFKFADYYSSFEGLEYRKFVAKGSLPVDEVLKFHSKCAAKANPTMEQVREKQDKFLAALPYRNLLRKEWTDYNPPT